MNKYYDKADLLSYHYYFNMLTGNRGGGKTYGFKTWAIDDFLKTGKQFAWIRRYCTEIDIMRQEGFFADIQDKYPEHKFEMKGNKKKGKFYVDGKVAGHYFALSTSAVAKSSSYPLIDKIIFDEFLIIGKTYHYLNDEVVMLLELIETIFRDRETNPDAKVKPRGVYLLGNNITVANPYYLYFGVKPFKQRFWRDKTRGILCEQYCNEEFVKLKKASKIGRLTANTTYAEYSIENKAYLDNDTFIGTRPSKCNFNCAIDYKGRTYGFWYDYKNGLMYVDDKYDPSSLNHYSLSRDDHSLNTFLIKNANSTYIKNVIWMFRNACMYFANQQIKNQIYELLSLFVR